VRHPGIDRDWLLAGHYQLEVATERVEASLHLEPLYDPRASRIRL
jgi:4-methylaminobutanoate oxidase (formaldehyde-forming)